MEVKMNNRKENPIELLSKRLLKKEIQMILRDVKIVKKI